MALQVLVADSSTLSSRQLNKTISQIETAEVCHVKNVEALTSAVMEKTFDLIFLDTLFDADGIESVLTLLQKYEVTTPLTLMSVDPQSEADGGSLVRGTVGTLAKPIDTGAMRLHLAALVLTNEAKQAAWLDREADALLQSVESLSTYETAAEALRDEINITNMDTLDVRVGVLRSSELAMITELVSEETVILVQDFGGELIAGEVLLVMDEINESDCLELLGVAGIENNTQQELFRELANRLNAAFLGAFGKQMGLKFVLAPPTLLHEHLLLTSSEKDNDMPAPKLVFEFTFTLDSSSSQGVILLVLQDDSISVLDNKLAYLLDDEEI
ncbi:response regulator [Veronia pacifica]|uniref:Response regulatory domain-containing protein n=1 Tax=Veronia pacifica TaxID=1080227 RepID=A0A1C3EG70_9GAMM|nr:response regulator [Veronia pacifica]ODA32225.1 hypothetical protein A8L45_13600 [Veronia pacifica]